MEAKISAVLKNENDEWVIELTADSPKAEKVLGKMVEENTSMRRSNSINLVLWMRHSEQQRDGSIKKIEFAISEGPDSVEFDEGKIGLRLLNLGGLFKNPL